MDISVDEYAIIIRLGGIINLSQLNGENIVNVLEDLKKANLLTFHVERSSNILGQYLVKLYITSKYSFSINFLDHILVLEENNTYLEELSNI